MNFDNLSAPRNRKPFIDTGHLKIVMVVDQDNHITEFEIIANDFKRIIKVKKQNILAAWKTVEQYCEKLI